LTSACYYSHSISKIILRAKEDNDRRARLLIANSIAQFISAPMTIVPIPSRKAALRRRGFDHSYLLAREVARLSDGNAMRILKVNRSIRDQTSVSNEDRYANLAGAYSAKCGNQPPSPVVLMDDLVTTGSSMREAIRALEDAGIRPSMLISACIASHQLPNTISTSTG
jgi:predicted amidophosphoribosyltransferase